MNHSTTYKVLVGCSIALPVCLSAVGVSYFSWVLRSIVELYKIILSWFDISITQGSNAFRILEFVWVNVLAPASWVLLSGLLAFASIRLAKLGKQIWTKTLSRFGLDRKPLTLQRVLESEDLIRFPKKEDKIVKEIRVALTSEDLKKEDSRDSKREKVLEKAIINYKKLTNTIDCLSNTYTKKRIISVSGSDEMCRKLFVDYLHKKIESDIRRAQIVQSDVDIGKDITPWEIVNATVNKLSSNDRFISNLSKKISDLDAVYICPIQKKILFKGDNEPYRTDLISEVGVRLVQGLSESGMLVIYCFNVSEKTGKDLKNWMRNHIIPAIQREKRGFVKLFISSHSDENFDFLTRAITSQADKVWVREHVHRDEVSYKCWEPIIKYAHPEVTRSCLLTWEDQWNSSGMDFSEMKRELIHTFISPKPSSNSQ
ncbi:MAG: hypothetical protein AAF558_09085 [Verrucomicrobiota bacterium]